MKENSRKESFAKTARSSFGKLQPETAAARYHNYTISRIIDFAYDQEELGLIDEHPDARLRDGRSSDGAVGLSLIHI